jgi:hypothetical protein
MRGMNEQKEHTRDSKDVEEFVGLFVAEVTVSQQ